MEIIEPVDFGMYVYNVNDSQHLCTVDNVSDMACCADSNTAKPWDGSDDMLCGLRKIFLVHLSMGKILVYKMLLS